MYKLILMLFIAALMVGCSKEEAGEMMDKADDAAEHAGDEATEHAGDEATEHAGDEATEHAGDEAESAKMDGPKLEPLPDWDSLPPIEEEMATADDPPMIEEAEEAAEEMAKEHAGDAAEEMKKE